jgi:Caspase domain
MCWRGLKRYNVLLFALVATTAFVRNSTAASYALIAGISQYGSQLRLTGDELLRFPESDAKAVYRILLSPHGGNIPPENIRLLLGPAATKSAVTAALIEWLVGAAQPADTVFIYFSGHGYLDEANEGYLIAYDTVRVDIPHTAVPLSVLRRALRAIRATTKVVFIDACHSGALNETSVAAERLRKNLLEIDGNTISLAASTAGQNALEGGGADDRHTLFGEFLISGLDGYADADCNGVITAQELAGYIEAQVSKWSNGTQRPSAALPAALRNLSLARYASPRCTGASAPDRRGDVRVKLSPFDCNDNPAVVQVDGRITGTICAGGALWVPGLPGRKYQLRVTRAGMQPREEVAEITPPAETLITLELRKRPARSDAAETELKKALELYTKGGATHYQDALAVLEKVRAQYPTDPELPYRIGLIHKVEGSAGTASTAFESALALDASHLMARTMLADLKASEQPAEAIRLLLEAPDLTANDVLSSVVLSRAYQRLHLCGESVQWAKSAAERAPARGDLQAEPLVEYAVSLKACAEEAKDAAIKIKLDSDAVDAFHDALERLKRFRSGVGGDIWYEVAGTVGAGWKFDAANKDQYERLLVDTYAGLCEVQGRRGQTCAALDACQEWTRLRKDDAEGRFRMTFNAASAANSNLVCTSRKWTWPAVCELYQSIPLSRLPPVMAQQASDLGIALRQSGRCHNLK